MPDEPLTYEQLEKAYAEAMASGPEPCDLVVNTSTPIACIDAIIEYLDSDA